MTIREELNEALEFKREKIWCTIFEGNNWAKILARAPEMYSKSKHISIKKVRQGKVKIEAIDAKVDVVTVFINHYQDCCFKVPSAYS